MRKYRYFRRMITTIALFACTICSSGGVFSQTENLEQQIKAAFLLKFVTYVEWPGPAPASPDAAAPGEGPLIFGIVGADNVARILEQMAAEEPGNGRAVEIRRLQPLQALDDVHVLFVGQTLENDAATMLREALAESVLTVTEANTQRPDDSVINFMIAGDRVAFDISLIAARRADLQLSSRLLQVAQRVIE